jgi:ABC-type phosphate transport system substrate-binding protein
MKINFKQVALALFCSVAGSQAQAGEVIAHASVTLSADEVKEVFQGDKQLAGSLKLVPVDNGAAQADFTAKVLASDVAKYTARWTKKSFREGLAAPAVKGSDAEVIAFVKATPGAVGYVASASSGVKVLQKF